MGEVRPLTRKDGRGAMAFGASRLPVGVSTNNQRSAPDRAQTLPWAFVALFAITSALTVNGERSASRSRFDGRGLEHAGNRRDAPLPAC